MNRVRNGPRYRAETDALLATLPVDDGPMELDDLVASRIESPDPRLTGPTRPVEACADVYLPLSGGPRRVRVYRDRPAPRPILLWLHGGGFVGGSLDDIDATCRALAATAGVVVVSLDYRLAPEDPFPAALDDTYDALSWLAEHGCVLGGDGRVAAGGQSAGANLVVAAALRAREAGGPQVECHVLAYPSLGVRQDSESFRLFDGVLFTKADLAWNHEQYLAGQPVTPLVAPLTAPSLAGLPPALILAAGRDPLRDDARCYHQRLTDAGVGAQLVEYADTMHAFLNFPGVLSAAGDAVDDIAGYLAGVLG
ncbi:MAG TPA: alpha/beta hydrolase [Jatrophihabitantaceae bacterium]|jgi:acetyl esterase